jgi:hypothetical protein
MPVVDAILIPCFFILSLIISHAIWCSVREIFVRQDLFAIRDDLWDVARERGGFEDPAYREARSHLNAVINCVHLVSVPLLLSPPMIAGTKGKKKAKLPRSSDHVLQKAIDSAYNAAAKRVQQYVFRDRILTCAVSVVGLVWHFSQNIKETAEANDVKLVRNWIASPSPIAIQEFERRQLVEMC